MTSRQKKGLIILLSPLSVLVIIITIFYYSGFFQPEFQIWGGTPLDILIFVFITTLGAVSLLCLLICLPLGLIYLTRPEKIIPEIKSNPTKELELKNQLTKTDNLIFIIITRYVSSNMIVYLIDWLLQDNKFVMNFFKLSPAAYKNISDTLQAVLGCILIILFVCVSLLLKKHFSLRKALGQKGIDSLAERFKKFFLPREKNNDTDLKT